jgi:hypothetical protein
VKLKGPADADHYRVKRGNFKERWYTDPLPADKEWPATADDFAVVSFSIAKGASGKDWTYVGLGRVADALHGKPLPKGRDAAYAALKNINDEALENAKKRGNGVHAHCDSKWTGYVDPMAETNKDAELYFDAVDSFFDTYRPELVASEYVAIHRTLNGVGYGCTGDLVAYIAKPPDAKPPGNYVIDWKSRQPNGDHTIYPEEAAQVAAAAGADYWIVDGPTRMRPLELAGGLIVSIKPDGFRVYPVDLAEAFEHWQAMHAWWVARRTEKQSIGRAWAPRKAEECPTPTSTPATSADTPESTTTAPNLSPSNEKLEWVRSRIRALSPAARQEMKTLWPDGAPTSPTGPFSDDQLEAISQLVKRLEAKHRILAPFPPAGLESTTSSTSSPEDAGTDSTTDGSKSNREEMSSDTPSAAASPWQPPEEGPEVDLTDTKRQVDALPMDAQRRIARYLAEAKHANRSFAVRPPHGKPTMRRTIIVSALAELIMAADNDDELIRHALSFAMHTELEPNVTTGTAIGSMTIPQAARLGLLAKALGANETGLRFDDEGHAFFELDLPA